MKIIFQFPSAALFLLSATAASATNGANMIGTGPKGCGMGGVGIAMAHGAESALANPALITNVKGKEISFAGTLFMPDVQYQGNPRNPGYGKSDADLNLIPRVAIASQVNHNLYWGMGMWGTGGMGVDYDTATEQYGTMEMGTNMQLMQFGVPIAYAFNGLSMGATVILQYGTLDIDYNFPEFQGIGQNPEYTYMHVGHRIEQDLNFGYVLGVAYEINGLTLGAIYKSPIDMVYDGVMTSAVKPFESAGVTGITDHLETPAEYGAGIAYHFLEKHTLAMDYRSVRWGDAKGYRDFNWQNQNIYAFGYEYTSNKRWSFRGGYNHGAQPIDDQIVSYPGGAALNVFNLLGAPAIIEKHYSLGSTYRYSNHFSMDLSLGYSPETKTSFDTAHINPETGEMHMYQVDVKHKQTSMTFGVVYNFMADQ
jgi:long-chain fatty acid transport protein